MGCDCNIAPRLWSCRKKNLWVVNLMLKSENVLSYLQNCWGYYTESGTKTSQTFFDCNLKKDYQILINFDTNISDTTADQMSVQFSTAPIVCFALPGETKLTKYCICILFCLFRFFHVVQKQPFGEVETKTVIWWQVVFFKSQSIMLGMFLTNFHLF